MSTTAARQAPRPDPPRLFLVTRQPGAYSSFLERLANIYHLYPYGRAGLSGIVKSESERAAFVLSIVFCFDLFAWSMIWNAVFRRGEIKLGWETVLAVLLGSLFALIVFNFEQGFIASDWSVRGPSQRAKLAIATVLRIAAIAASAWATAQPLELLVFARDIQGRVHQERVWEEIAVQALEFQRLESEQKGEGSMQRPLAEAAASDALVSKDQEDVADNNAQLGEAQAHKTSLENSLPRLRRDSETKRQNYLAAKQASDSQEEEKAYAAWQKSKRALDNLPRRISEAEEKISQKTRDDVRLKARVAAAKDVRDKKVQFANTEMKGVTSRLEGLRNWVRTLSLSGPEADTIEAPPEIKTTDLHISDFKVLPYSFAEQQRVLDDLRFGRPIQRHNLTLVNPDLLHKELQLQDQKTADQASKGDREASALVISRQYWSLFIVAVFIPAMGLIFKLIIHQRLGDYYSEEYQAANGHPEAMQAIQTSQLIKQRRSEAKRKDGDRYRDGHIL